MPAKRWTARRAWPALAVVLPFVLVAWLDLAPGRLWLAGIGLLVLVLALRGAGWEVETMRFTRPPGLLARVAGGSVRAFGWLAIGVLLALLVSGVAAGTGGRIPSVTPDRADAVYELDARVPTRPQPACLPRVASTRVLLERGAHPRLAPEGDFLWFDATAEDGHRQIYRQTRATGEVTCWTCGEAGNNERPSPGEGRHAVAFETDRYVSWREPLNHEIQLLGVGGDAPSAPSIRLTIDPASDRAPLLGPSAQLVVWSRQSAGRQQLVGAGIRAGHGGVLLGAPNAVARGGLAAVVPLAWSPDARSLVFARGNLLGPVSVVRLDPATGLETPLGDGAAAVPADTSADGGWLVVATGEAGGVAARLPSWLGFVLAPLATALGIEAPTLRGTGIRAGEPWAEGAPLDLGDVAAWGGPTGLALDPSGNVLVLGQRRETSVGVEERIVELTLACGEPGSAP
jgi:hypothetical protein